MFLRFTRPARRFSSTFVSVNGQPVSDGAGVSVSIYDESFQRGDGVFEVVRILGSGRPRGLDLHLDRLERSADAIGVPLPPRATVADWIGQAAAAGGGNGAVRLMATKGAANPNEHSSAKVFVMWQPLPSWPDTFRLQPMAAPWHAAGQDGWAAVKWLSYSVNVHSTRLAKQNGFTDALLLARHHPETGSVLAGPGGGGGGENASGAAGGEDGGDLAPMLNMHVLDGPNFCVGWLRNGGVEFPDWQRNGLLQSTSQALATQAAEEVLRVPVSEGVFTLRDAVDAEEMFVMSSTRGVIRVESVGSKAMPDAGFAKELSAAMDTVCEA